MTPPRPALEEALASRGGCLAAFGEGAAALDAFRSALLAHTRRRPGQALQLARRALRHDGPQLDDAGRAHLHRLLGHARREVGLVREAIASYGESRELFERAGEAHEAAVSGIGLVDALAKAGDGDAAEELAGELRRQLSRHEPVLRARLESNLANNALLAGDPARAARLYRKAHETLEAAGLARDAALVDYNLAHAQLLLARADDAEAGFRRARRRFTAAQFDSAALQCRFGLALCALHRGEVARAWEEFVAVQAGLRESGDLRAAAAVGLESARVLAALGATRDAGRQAQDAAELLGRLGLPQLEAEARSLLARCHAHRGEESDALLALEVARERAREAGVEGLLPRLDLDAAAIQLQRGERARAAALLRRLPARGSSPAHRAAAEELRGRLALSRGRVADAERAAHRGWRAVSSMPASSEAPALALLLARCRERRGDRRGAWRWAQRSAERVEQMYAALAAPPLSRAAGPWRRDLHRELVELALGLGGPRAAARALELLERVREPMLVREIQEGPWSDPELRAALARLRQQWLDEPGGGPGDIRSATLARLRPSTGRAPGRSARPSRGRGRPREELLLYHRGATGWSAFHRARSGRVRHRELPGVERALEEHWLPLRMLFDAASSLPAKRREAFLRETRDEARAAMDALRECLWSPLAPLVGDGELAVVCEPALQGVPLEALALGPAGEGPVLRRRIHPRVAARRPRSHPGPPSALLLHDGRPASRRELDVAQASLRRGGWRTRRSGRSRALSREEGPFDRLHVAAHGVADPAHWVGHGIRLQDGWLGLEALSSPALAGSEAVLLSCESALGTHGPGAEMDGWLSAGLAAGLSGLVLALWKIDDRAAGVVAERLHGGAGGRPGALPRRLRQVLAQLRDAGEHPWRWAAFCCGG